MKWSLELYSTGKKIVITELGLFIGRNHGKKVGKLFENGCGKKIFSKWGKRMKKNQKKNQKSIRKESKRMKRKIKWWSKEKFDWWERRVWMMDFLEDGVWIFGYKKKNMSSIY